MNKFISKISRSYYNCFVNKESPVFIHIPKTGGTYIGQFENYGRPAFWPVEHLGHVAVVENEDHVSDYLHRCRKNRHIVMENAGPEIGVVKFRINFDGF